LGARCKKRPLKPSFLPFRPFNLSDLTLLTTKGKGIKKAIMWRKEGSTPYPRRLSPKRELRRLG